MRVAFVIVNVDIVPVFSTLKSGKRAEDKETAEAAVFPANRAPPPPPPPPPVKLSVPEEPETEIEPPEPVTIKVFIFPCGDPEL